MPAPCRHRQTEVHGESHWSCARAAQYYSRPDVVYVPFSDAPLVEYGLLWTAANSTPKVQAFIETLLETARSSDPAGL